ncbi:uncharacterized protein TNCT_405001 [Trichonephila clavata]|uniref:Uncharacterized protein n=1 Tax=Trichonephila clavata TaxID=2740835 RepID=A0A8X6GJ89_TRICU|nr:uncharacterized protein TNCT_405001 [Trichonephila clavata]
MKKIRKAIAKKFKNWKATTSKETATQEPKISSREEAKKPLEIIIEQHPTVVTAETTTARSEKVLQDTIGNIETPADAYENSNKSSLEESIEHKPCENSNEIATEDKDIAASIEKLDNTVICEKNETAVTETDIKEPNASNSPSSTACFDSQGNSVDEKSSEKAIQLIVAGVVGAVLLVSCVALYIMKMPVVAVVVGIVGLACISFALYHTLKPNTKLEKVKSVEQPIVESPLNPT